MNDGSGNTSRDLIDHFFADLTIDFSNNALFGEIFTKVSNAADTSDEFRWNLVFDGLQTPSSSLFTFDDGEAIVSFPSTTQFQFDFSGNTQTPILAGSYQSRFSFSPDAYISVAGVFAGSGFVEDRISAGELFEMAHSSDITMMIETGESRVLFGQASISDTTLLGFNDLPVDHSKLFKQPYETVIATSGSPDYELDNVNGLDVDWGYWNSNNMTIMNNRLNASDSYIGSSDLFWAHITPSTDIADRSGEYYYYADYYNYAVGKGVLDTGNAGVMDYFEMYFYVDFSGSSASAISGGWLDARLTNPLDTYDRVSYDVSFTGGTLNGALVEFNGISGNIYDGLTEGTICLSCVAGEIGGVFTGTASGSSGGSFVTGFSLHQIDGPSSIQGMSTLHGYENTAH